MHSAVTVSKPYHTEVSQEVRKPDQYNTGSECFSESWCEVRHKMTQTLVVSNQAASVVYSNIILQSYLQLLQLTDWQATVNVTLNIMCDFELPVT